MAPHSPSQLLRASHSPRHWTPPEGEEIGLCLFSFYFGHFTVMRKGRLKWSLSPALPSGITAGLKLCAGAGPSVNITAAPHSLCCPPCPFAVPETCPALAAAGATAQWALCRHSRGSRPRAAAAPAPSHLLVPRLPKRFFPVNFWSRATITHKQT